MRHSIYACFVQKNATITGKYTLVYRTSETKYFSPQWSTYEIALIIHSLVYITDIDVAALKTTETLRECSGWTGELVMSGVATSG